MKEKAKEYLLSLGYDEATVNETIANATEEELADLVPTDVKPKLKPKPKVEPKPKAMSAPKKFDPVAAATNIVKKQEGKPPVKYTVTPCYKLTICSEVDTETMRAITAELKARGGRWSEELGGFLFDFDPETVL